MLSPTPILSTVSDQKPAEALYQMLHLIRAQTPILDVTYGRGNFWKTPPERRWSVWGSDLAPARAKDLVADFRQLPFGNRTVPTVIYDPPFHPTGTSSHEHEAFGGLGKSAKAFKQLFCEGLRECWRVTDGYLLVKCQGYINEDTPQWMPLWAVKILGEPYEWLMLRRPSKLASSTWHRVFSLRRNHADYLVWSRRGNTRRYSRSR